MGADFGNFLGGLTTTLDQQRSDARAAQERQDARETAIFQSLANSDDPDIRAAAVTGLLTGKHPGKFMDRFLGKMQTHPAFEQIRGLVADGHQAYLGDTETTKRRTAAQTEGQITGRVSGAVSGARNAGAPLTEDQIRRVSMGAVGAAQGRTLPKQKVVIKRRDGSTVGGYFDQETGGFFDDEGQPVDDVVSYQNAAGTSAARTGTTGVGASWVNTTMGKYRQMVAAGMAGDMDGLESIPDDAPVRARFSPDGKTAGRPVYAAPPPQAPSFSPVQTNEGIASFNNRSGGVNLAAGGGGLRQPVAPATSAGAVRAIQDGILRMHKPPTGLLGTGPSPRERQAWQQGVDNEAQRYGYPNFAALQAAVAEETANVQSAVQPGNAVQPGTPPPQAPAPVPAPGGGRRPARGAAPGAAPGASGDANDPLGVRHLLPR